MFSVFLTAPVEVRVPRLRERELARFDYINEEFIAWAAQYDVGTMEGRNLHRHLAWLAKRRCPVIRLASTVPVEVLVAAVRAQAPNPFAFIERTRPSKPALAQSLSPMSHALLYVTHAGLPALKFAATSPSSRSAIIWLHGIGERGTDPSIVANYGLPAALATGRAFATCDVLCPQLPDGKEWSSSLVRSIVLYAQPNYEAVVLIGYSLGGLGVLDLVANFGATCSLQVSIASGIPNTPVPAVSQVGVHLLSLQGEHDLQPEVSSFVAQVQRLGGVAEEEIIKGGNHYISESALWQPGFQAALASKGISLRPQAAFNTNPSRI